MSVESSASTALAEPSSKVRGFRAEILTGPHHSPNGGISARVRYVTIIGDKLPAEMRIHPVSDDAPAVKLQCSGDTVDAFRKLNPVAPVPEGHIGYMASGAFVHSVDSRWSLIAPAGVPLPLHDRIESTTLYDLLSS